MKFTKILVISLASLIIAVHGEDPHSSLVSFPDKTFTAPLKKSAQRSIPPLLRGLQPEPPDLPDPPGEGEGASYCDFLFLLFEAQANAYGYDCECVSENGTDTVSCNARSLTCDKYGVGEEDLICHSDHFTASTTEGVVGDDEYNVIDFEACATYSDSPYAPDSLAGSEICFVYKLSIVWDQGYNLDECGLTFAAAGGAPQQICTCSFCSATFGDSGPTYMGLGLDCQDSLLPNGITLVQCQPLTDQNPAVIPIVEEVRQDDADPVNPSTADSVTTTVVADDSPTVDSVTATIVPTADSLSSTVVADDSSTADPPMATSTDSPSLTTPTTTDSSVSSNRTDQLPPKSAGAVVNLKSTVGIIAVGFLVY